MIVVFHSTQSIHDVNKEKRSAFSAFLPQPNSEQLLSTMMSIYHSDGRWLTSWANIYKGSVHEMSLIMHEAFNRKRRSASLQRFRDFDANFSMRATLDLIKPTRNEFQQQTSNGDVWAKK